MISSIFNNNILLNRLHILNNKIEKSWLNLSLESYKVKCKELFLKNQWDYHWLPNELICLKLHDMHDVLRALLIIIKMHYTKDTINHLNTTQNKKV